MSPSGDSCLADLFLGRPRSRRYPKFNIRRDIPASAELKDKIERLRGLMRGSIPDGDLGAIIEEAVTEKLERLESRRFGKTKAPRKSVEETDTSPSSRYIPAAVRREVSERDGNQCTFVDVRGRRCNERQALQFHHHDP